MEADEIVKALVEAKMWVDSVVKVDPQNSPTSFDALAMLALAEALCCDECNEAGTKWVSLGVREICPKCSDIRSAVRRWKEGCNA